MTVTCYPPPHCDLSSWGPTLSCAIWLPSFDVPQRWCETQVSQVIHIGCASRFWGSVCVLLCFIKPILGNCYVRSRDFIVSEPSMVALCQFVRALGFLAHELFYWNHTDLVTNKIILPHPPFFLWSVILICVNTDIDVVLRGMRMLSLYVYYTPPPFKCVIFPACHLLHYARPGGSRTYTTTPIMSDCYNGSWSDRFCWKQHVK